MRFFWRLEEFVLSYLACENQNAGSLEIDAMISEKDDDLLRRTRRLSRAVTEIFDAKLKPFGVSAVQFALLEAIDQLGPATRAAIARNQGLDKSTLTRDLKSILANGLVEEVGQGANGRSRPIALTPAGKRLLLGAELACRAAQDEGKALLSQHGFTAARGERAAPR
jgi:DNA-binding MarR family transcriptional regulator